MNHRLSVNRRDITARKPFRAGSGPSLGRGQGPLAEGSVRAPWTAERFHQATEPGRWWPGGSGQALHPIS